MNVQDDNYFIAKMACLQGFALWQAFFIVRLMSEAPKIEMKDYTALEQAFQALRTE